MGDYNLPLELEDFCSDDEPITDEPITDDLITDEAFFQNKATVVYINPFACTNCNKSLASAWRLKKHIENNCKRRGRPPESRSMSTKRELDLSREDSGQDNHVTHIIKVQLEKKARYVSLLLSLFLSTRIK